MSTLRRRPHIILPKPPSFSSTGGSSSSRTVRATASRSRSRERPTERRQGGDADAARITCEALQEDHGSTPNICSKTEEGLPGTCTVPSCRTTEESSRRNISSDLSACLFSQTSGDDDEGTNNSFHLRPASKSYEGKEHLLKGWDRMSLLHSVEMYMQTLRVSAQDVMSHHLARLRLTNFTEDEASKDNATFEVKALLHELRHKYEMARKLRNSILLKEGLARGPTSVDVRPSGVEPKSRPRQASHSSHFRSQATANSNSQSTEQLNSFAQIDFNLMNRRGSTRHTKERISIRNPKDHHKSTVEQSQILAKASSIPATADGQNRSIPSSSSNIPTSKLIDKISNTNFELIDTRNSTDINSRDIDDITMRSAGSKAHHVPHRSDELATLSKVTVEDNCSQSSAMEGIIEDLTTHGLRIRQSTQASDKDAESRFFRSANA